MALDLDRFCNRESVIKFNAKVSNSAVYLPCGPVSDVNTYGSKSGALIGEFFLLWSSKTKA